MLKIRNVTVSGYDTALRGMRNPYNSWSKADSSWCGHIPCEECTLAEHTTNGWECFCPDNEPYVIGPNDMELALKLIKAGPEHRKFLRMIHLTMDITAPLYWWKQFDTYKVGTTSNSCSTMHMLTSKEFELDDFSHEYMNPLHQDDSTSIPELALQIVIDTMNIYREKYLETKDKDLWYAIVQMLPMSYNQRRMIDLDMETLLSIVRQRTGHKLDEWRTFIEEVYPYVPYLEEFSEALK